MALDGAESCGGKACMAGMEVQWRIGSKDALRLPVLRVHPDPISCFAAVPQVSFVLAVGIGLHGVPVSIYEMASWLLRR